MSISNFCRPASLVRRRRTSAVPACYRTRRPIPIRPRSCVQLLGSVGVASERGGGDVQALAEIGPSRQHRPTPAISPRCPNCRVEDLLDPPALNKKSCVCPGSERRLAAHRSSSLAPCASRSILSCNSVTEPAASTVPESAAPAVAASHHCFALIFRPLGAWLGCNLGEHIAMRGDGPPLLQKLRVSCPRRTP